MPLLLISFPAVLQMTGADPEVSDLVLWKKVLESARSTVIAHCVQYVVGLQWAVWLAQCQLKPIKEFQVHSCLYSPYVVCSST